jgi:16S rRNA (adenine(1408)-N(1))-methyltransferase
VLAEARRRPGTFVLGVDAVAETMADAARRAGAKASRGGVDNAMLVCAAAEALPGLLAGAADEIIVNYPWGSLLRALAAPDESVLARIAKLGKPGAMFAALVNVQPMRDVRLAERLKLSGAALLREPALLSDAYARAGLEALRIQDVSEDPAAATSWGRHLVVSKREIWKLEARVAAG